MGALARALGLLLGYLLVTLLERIADAAERQSAPVPVPVPADLPFPVAPTVKAHQWA